MKVDPQQLDRLRFLARVVQRERDHLRITDQRVFHEPFTTERARGLAHDVEEDPAILADALQAGHEYVPTLSSVVEIFINDMRDRGWQQGSDGH